MYKKKKDIQDERSRREESVSSSSSGSDEDDDDDDDDVLPMRNPPRPNTSRAYTTRAFVEIANCFIYYLLNFMLRASVDLVESSYGGGSVNGIIAIAFGSAAVSFVSVQIADIVDSGLVNPIFTIIKMTLGKLRGQRQTLDFSAFFMFLAIQFIVSLFCASVVFSLFDGIVTSSEFQYGIPTVNPFRLDMTTTAVFAAEMIGSGILAFTCIIYVISYEKLFPNYHGDAKRHDATTFSVITFAVVKVFYLFSSSVFNPLLHLSMAIVLLIAGKSFRGMFLDNWIFYVAPLLSAVFCLLLYYVIFRMWNLETAVYYSKIINQFIKEKTRALFFHANTSSLEHRYINQLDPPPSKQRSSSPKPSSPPPPPSPTIINPQQTKRPQIKFVTR